MLMKEDRGYHPISSPGALGSRELKSAHLVQTAPRRALKRRFAKLAHQLKPSLVLRLGRFEVENPLYNLMCRGTVHPLFRKERILVTSCFLS